MASGACGDGVIFSKVPLRAKRGESTDPFLPGRIQFSGADPELTPPTAFECAPGRGAAAVARLFARSRRAGAGPFARGVFPCPAREAWLYLDVGRWRALAEAMGRAVHGLARLTQPSLELENRRRFVECRCRDKAMAPLVHHKKLRMIPGII